MNYRIIKKDGKYGAINNDTNTTIIPFEYDNIYDFEETAIAKINNSLSLIEIYNYDKLSIDQTLYKSSDVDYKKLNIVYRFKLPITAAILHDKYATFYDILGNVLFVNYKPTSYKDCVIKYVITQMRIEKLKLLI